MIHGKISLRSVDRQSAEEREQMTMALSPPEQRVILHGISWDTYERLLADYAERSSPRFTYDRGVLEIMSPSTKHERLHRLLADLFTVIASEMLIEFDNVGSNTFKRADLARGFEPDSCFYVQNVEHISDKEQIDLVVDPPPDLVIEIDITSSSLDRFPIFAAIGVLEVWHYDGKELTIFTLESGSYTAQNESVALPGVTSTHLSRFMEESKSQKRTAWLRSVRAWAQTQRGQ